MKNALALDILSRITPEIERACRLDTEKLIDHLSRDLDVEKDIVSRSVNKFFGKKVNQRNVTHVFSKGEGIFLIEDYSDKGCAVVGDIKPLGDLFKDMGYLSQTKHIKLGNCWTMSKKREEEFLDEMERLDISCEKKSTAEYLA